VADLAVLTPSRGRPERLYEMVSAVHDLAFGDVEVWVGLDQDDAGAYFEAGFTKHRGFRCRIGPRKSLSGWTNFLAGQALNQPEPPRYLASLGDDHRPRSKGWDVKLIEAIEQLDGPGFAYGNDLLQGANLPTTWVMSSDVYRALGWVMLPALQHMYVDSAVLELGRASNRIAYRPDVIVEHVHPAAGKTDWDESYRESNAPARYAEDRRAFEAWKANGLVEDVAKIEALVYAR
jgi:hypothetical protein